jgi:ubiquinol-cytochrome c reductase cytochrome c1 subunit
MKRTGCLAGMTILAALATATAALAAESANQKCIDSLGTANADVRNTASLQKGARNFANYCLGCHSLGYMRWNRVAADLGLTEDELKANLILTGDKPYEYIRSPMPAKDAEEWFGRAPPDLTLITRSKGSDYVYRFLKGFYEDNSPTRPTGVNNLMLEGASMPAVLADLQGVQRLKFHLEDEQATGNAAVQVCDALELAQPGRMTPAEFDGFVHDTVNFLTYVGEPVKAKRESLGILVVLFLAVFTAFAYLLKKEYWKDVH